MDEFIGVEQYLQVPSRVVLHLDLDCFYCQVEQKRLSIPRDVPCAVQQWNGLIAVNYAARGKGVTRHMKAREATEKFPDLRLVHVETIGVAGRDAGDLESTARNRLKEKACLERYREASSRIMNLLQSTAPMAIFEKASIDEVYMDVTSMVNEELESKGFCEGEGASVAAEEWLEEMSCTAVLGGALQSNNESDCMLAAGAAIAKRLRDAVFSELSFTCSAGIAHNKQLAKLASAMNKPNKQTIVAMRGVQPLMQNLDLKKIRFFGGKLGKELEEMGCHTAGDVQNLPQDVLKKKFGAERARWMAMCVRGINDEPVQPKSMPKSMLAAKSFTTTSNVAEIERWMFILAQELAERIKKDQEKYKRKPRNLVLHYRRIMSNGSYERSRSCSMPQFGKDGLESGLLAEMGMHIFRKLDDVLPCNRLALSAADFVDAPVSAKKSITRFFTVNTPNKDKSMTEQDKPGASIHNPECSGRIGTPPQLSPAVESPTQPPPARDKKLGEEKKATVCEVEDVEDSKDEDIIDLGAVDVMEQQRILMGIQGSKNHVRIRGGSSKSKRKGRAERGQLQIAAMFAANKRSKN